MKSYILIIKDILGTSMEESMSTSFDRLTQTRELQMLKTAVPYINDKRKMQLAILIKFIELKNTARYFNTAGASLAMCSVDEDTDFPLSMLIEMRKFCNEKEQETIDMITNIISFRELGYEL
jgi:hypothetical protein